MPLPCWAVQQHRSGSLLSALPASLCLRQPPASAVSAAVHAGFSQRRRHVPLHQATSLQLDCSTASAVHDQAQPHQLQLALGLSAWPGFSPTNGAAVSNGKACHFVLEPPEPAVVPCDSPQQPKAAVCNAHTSTWRQSTANGRSMHSISSSTEQQQPSKFAPGSAQPAELRGKQLQGSTTTMVRRSVAQGMVSPPTRFPAPEARQRSEQEQAGRMNRAMQQQPTMASAAQKTRKKRRRKPAGQPPHISARTPAMTVSRTSGVDVRQQYLQHQQALLQEQLHPQQQHEAGHQPGQQHRGLLLDSQQLEPALHTDAQHVSNSSVGSSSGMPWHQEAVTAWAPPQQQQQRQSSADQVRTQATWLYLSPDSIPAAGGNNASVYVQYTLDGVHWQTALFVPVQTVAGTRLLAASIPPARTRRTRCTAQHNVTFSRTASVQSVMGSPHGANAADSTRSDAYTVSSYVGPQHANSRRFQAAVCMSAVRPAGPPCAPDTVVQLSSGGLYMLHVTGSRNSPLPATKQQQGGSAGPGVISTDSRMAAGWQPQHRPAVQTSLEPQKQQGQQGVHNGEPAATADGMTPNTSSAVVHGGAGCKDSHSFTIVAVPLLSQACLLIADLAMVAGRKRVPQDDQLCAEFSRMWQASQQIHASMLVYATHRSWSWFEHIWRDKQAVLQQPDAVILSGGTRVMYQVAGGMWQEDHTWLRHINKLWNRDRVVAAVKHVAQSLQPGTMSGTQQQHQIAAASHHSNSKLKLTLAPTAVLDCVAQVKSTGGHAGVLVADGMCVAGDAARWPGPQTAVIAPPCKHAAGPGQHPPSSLVRADTQAEQGPHLVRVLVHQQVLQQFLDGLQQELRHTAVGAAAQAPGHSHTPHSPDALQVPLSAAADLRNRAALTTSKAGHADAVSCSASSSATMYVSPTSRATITHCRQLQQLQRGGLQRPIPHHSHATDKPPLTWQCVVQPPSLAGVRNGNWYVVDIIPRNAGTDAAVQHILSRFKIRPHVDSLPAVRTMATVPVHSPGACSPCTHAVVFQDKAVAAGRQLQRMQTPAHWQGGVHSRAWDLEAGPHQAGLLHGVESRTCAITQGWGAAGVLDGLQQLGLVGTVFASKLHRP